jgi:hypothetical protein
MGLAGQELESYLGRYSAVGLLLAWLGVFAVGSGFLAISVDDFGPYFGPVLLTWGAVAIVLGLLLRRGRPSAGLWVLSNLWLGAAMLAFVAASIFGEFNG